MSRWHTRQPVARKSLRDTLTGNLAAFKSNGRPADPVRAARYDGQVARWEEQIASLGPKRERKPKPEALDIDAIHRKQDDTEAPVLRAIGTMLAVHPLVLIAIRQNSGAMHYQGSNGRAIPVWFYKFARKPVDELRVTDFWGFLRDGRPFAIDAKKPSWNGRCTTDSEKGQQAFIHMIEAIGGIGGFARNVDEAAAILPT